MNPVYDPRRENEAFPAYHDDVNDPETEIPVDDPPVPNRAWTEMSLGRDIEELSEEEKADLYLGRDNYL